MTNRTDSETVTVYHGVTNVELEHPYRLSYTTLRSYDVLWVAVRQGDHFGLGEAVALPGYGSSSTDWMVHQLEGTLPSGTEIDREQSLSIADTLYNVDPFLGSAMLTALQMPEFTEGSLEEPREIPLIDAVNAAIPPTKLEERIEQFLESPYRFLKVKAGASSLPSDRRGLELIDGKLRGTGARLRVDANQGYQFDEALELLDLLGGLGTPVDWLEQPLSTKEDDKVEQLKNAGGPDVVLDESIYTRRDLVQALTNGADGIKLKLCKHRGIQETIQLIEEANERGLRVVFGNGVSTDIGNLVELLIIEQCSLHTEEGFEGVGFEKIQQPLVFPELKSTGGGVIRPEKTREEFQKTVDDRVEMFLREYD